VAAVSVATRRKWAVPKRVKPSPPPTLGRFPATFSPLTQKNIQHFFRVFFGSVDTIGTSSMIAASLSK
jgi:hypothetical protein